MIKSCIKWNENIRKNTIGQGDDHTIGCLFHYLYFKENYYKLIPPSTQDNPKWLENVKLRFKRILNWNKYQSNVEHISQNSYLNHLIDPSFQEVNRLFAL